MTTRLITRNADSTPLDWGTSIEFASHGVRAVGRADSPNYQGPWFEGLTYQDVTITTVSDDYESPAGVSPQTTKKPEILSATAFNKLCAVALGGGVSDQQMMTGMAAFQKIMDDATHAGGAARFVVTQYTKAITFEKAEVVKFAAVLTAPGVDVMTQEQASAILAAWPEY